MRGVIATRYDKELMNLAAGGNQVDQVAAGLDDLADTFLAAPQLGAFLADTRVPQAVKQETVAAILEKAQVSELVGRFVRYITHKRRIALLGEMRDIFHRLADERLGRAQASCRLRHPGGGPGRPGTGGHSQADQGLCPPSAVRDPYRWPQTGPRQRPDNK